MAHVKVGPAPPDRKTLDAEIAHLRDLGIGDLQVRWQNVFRQRPPPHLPRRLLRRDGASVVRRDAAMNRLEDPDV